MSDETDRPVPTGDRDADPDPFHLIWLTGHGCDGCTIRALGDTTRGGLEAIFAGEAEGFPPVRVHHPIFATRSGTGFLEPLGRAADGQLGRYGLVSEASLSKPEGGSGSLFASMGAEDGRPVSLGRWLERLAPGADFVVAWGDCAVWGGPHSIGSNPSHATGLSMYLESDYRSRLDLPVINLPGCAPPAVLLETLGRLLEWISGEGPPLELDSTDRPAFAYARDWSGALVTWEE